MSRNWIILVVLIIVLLISVVYDFVQITVANASQKEALFQRELAVEEKLVSDSVAAKYVSASLELKRLKQKCE